MQELSILLINAVAFPLNLQELQHKRPSRTNIGASGEKVAAYERFEHARFATTLTPNHGDLREFDRVRAAELREDILELVDDWNHRVT